MIEGDALAGLLYGVPQGIGIGGAFLFVKWVADFIAKRTDRREDRVDAGMRALLDDHREEIDRLKQDCVSLREGLAECERKHTESEQEVSRLRGMMQGYGDAKQLAQMNAAADKARESKK
jgi:hypothetical protein